MSENEELGQFDFYEPKLPKYLSGTGKDELYDYPPKLTGPELWWQERGKEEPEDPEILGNVHIHEVTPSGRYVVVVSYLSGDIADERYLAYKAKITQAALEAWWESGEKFMVLVSGPDFEVLVTRVDDDGVEIAVGLEVEPDDGN